jgi:hypothetical protein
MTAPYGYVIALLPPWRIFFNAGRSEASQRTTFSSLKPLHVSTAIQAVHGSPRS